MSGWIICYKKDTSSLLEDAASRVQINIDSVKYLSIYDNKIEIDFVDSSFRVFYFKDWEIKM